MGKYSSMKIIVAGYSKTGTKSLNRALTCLGYSVDDLAEHLSVRTDYWWRIFTAADPQACSPEIFKEMYKDVDACMDTPAYLFWEQRVGFRQNYQCPVNFAS